VILEIDVQGAIQVRHRVPDALALFILPPDDRTLFERLRDRRRETEAEIERRFAEARREIDMAHESGVYDHFIVNDELERAISEALRIVDDTRAARRGGG
jgi:guanylate kinase